MAKFTLAPKVEEAVLAYAAYIARDNFEAAQRLVEAAYSTFAELAATPGMGRPRRFQNSKLNKVRSWRVSGFGNYLVFYQESPEGVHILRFYHGARNLDSLFEDPK